MWFYRFGFGPYGPTGNSEGMSIPSCLEQEIGLDELQRSLPT